MPISGKDGLAAEEYFLKAAEQIGFRVAETKAEEEPGTIRKTIENTEESIKTDFFLWLKTGERIPVELTLISRENGDKEKSHMKKKKNHREGKVLLLWPNRLFSKEMVRMGFGRKKAQRAALQWLKEAAEGGYEAKLTFRHWLLSSCEKFIKMRTL